MDEHLISVITRYILYLCDIKPRLRNIREKTLMDIGQWSGPPCDLLDYIQTDHLTLTNQYQVHNIHRSRVAWASEKCSHNY